MESRRVGEGDQVVEEERYDNVRSEPRHKEENAAPVLSPSPEYLSIADQTSQFRAPYQSNYRRKLLILDLNGTLLFRNQQRNAQLRPYMNSFREYLLCPETRTWLDIMVWSSAQPHNVEKMVRRCFQLEHNRGPMNFSNQGQYRGNQPYWSGTLLAVWARDTLGLNTNAYKSKTQTTKDLEKPWSRLPGHHSPLTTILLDDSPAKVKLQPYNHICVKAYNQDLRLKDLRTHVIKASASMSTSAQSSHGDKSDSSQCVEADDVGHEVVEGEPGNEETSALIREQRRKENKERKKALKAAGLLENSSSVVKYEETRVAKYDETLLAVIGILDVMRVQSNVAAWIRAGGLWANKGPPVARPAEPERDISASLPRAPSPTDIEVDDIEADNARVDPPSSSLPPPTSSPTRSPPSSPRSNSKQPHDIPSHLNPLSPTLRKRMLSSSPTEHDASGSGVKRSRNETSSRDHESAIDVEARARAQPAVVRTGNDGETLTEALYLGENSLSRAGMPSPEGFGRIEANGSNAKLWFEDEEVFNHWVAEGRRVLHALNIVEDPGINDY